MAPSVHNQRNAIETAAVGCAAASADQANSVSSDNGTIVESRVAVADRRSALFPCSRCSSTPNCYVGLPDRTTYRQLGYSLKLLAFKNNEIECGQHFIGEFSF